MKQNNQIIFGILGLCALIGVLDAGFLSYNHFGGVIPPCSVVSGCESVLTSKYSVVAGIPVAYTGLFYYLVFLFSAGLAYAEKGGKWAPFAATWLPKIGFLVSLGLVYLQLFVINAICVYCMVSASISLIALIASFFVRLDKTAKEV